MQWLVVLPLEIVAATLTIEFWSKGNINSDAWVAIFLALIIAINMFGVRGCECTTPVLSTGVANLISKTARLNLFSRSSK